MTKYKSAVGTVEAFQWTGNRDQDLPEWFDQGVKDRVIVLTYDRFHRPLLELVSVYAGSVPGRCWIAHIEDWIIYHGPSFISPKSDKLFREHYILVT